MSRKDQGPDKAPPRAVAVPALPRCDEGNREKWAAEYDRVEAQLLQRHLSTPSTSSTVTLGLRLVPTNFDRKVPAPDDPVGSEGRQLRAAATLHANSRSAAGRRSPPRASTTEPSDAAIDRLSPIRSVDRGRRRQRPASAMEVGGGEGGASARDTVTSPLPSAASVNAKTCLRALLTLLDPPPQFRASFDINTRGIDIAWIRHYKPGGRTARLLTLEIVREDMHVNPSARHEAALTSPRSVVVMLRNGVVVDDLQMEPPAAFAAPGVSDEVAAVAHRHHEERRKRLLGALREEYRELCDHIPLLDVLDSVAASRSGATAAAAASPDEHTGDESTLIRERRRKREHNLAANREKLQRSLEYSEQLHHQLEEADARRAQLDRELQERKRAQREAARQRAEAAARHMQELRQSSEKSNLEFVRRVDERRARMEEKEKRREAARAQQRALRHAELERRAALKEERLSQNREHLERIEEEQMQRYREREERARERKQKLDAQRSASREGLTERLQRANELRDAARRKAAAHEATAIAKAEARAQRARERIERHFEEQRRARAEQQRSDREREEQRRCAMEAAEAKRSERKAQILHDRAEHLSRLEESRAEREARLHHDQELERMTADDKRFFVQRRARALEFRKLMSISDIAEKEERAAAMSVQRSRLLEATLRDREMLRLERERVEREASKIKL